MKAEKKEGEGIVIGYDRRFLSKEAVIWACEIFGKQGIKVFFYKPQFPHASYHVLCDETPFKLRHDGNGQP
uniref:hypothetical protein n=1 Tax=Clostridium sp. NkU-1 TaxID=1095009 RepID=UPI0032613333